MSLTALETRIIGCLLEKERTTPENYPLSLHGLTAACCQTTNREPIMSVGEKEVEAALDELRQKKFATVVFGAGARVQKYRHNINDLFQLTAQEMALLCVLLLRGPQTVGELRARTERLAPFASLQEAEACLENLAGGSEPLARQLPARPGQKERRYVQLLSGEVEEEPLPPGHAAASLPAEDRPPSRLDALETEVRELRTQVAAMKEELAAFRRQFE